ncbi:MAG: hypothetical protein BJ554DRAFT_6339, partial [Olpidium bornovanus]
MEARDGTRRGCVAAGRTASRRTRRARGAAAGAAAAACAVAATAGAATAAARTCLSFAPPRRASGCCPPRSRACSFRAARPCRPARRTPPPGRRTAVPPSPLGCPSARRRNRSLPAGRSARSAASGHRACRPSGRLGPAAAAAAPGRERGSSGCRAAAAAAAPGRERGKSGCRAAARAAALSRRSGRGSPAGAGISHPPPASKANNRAPAPDPATGPWRRGRPRECSCATEAAARPLPAGPGCARPPAAPPPAFGPFPADPLRPAAPAAEWVWEPSAGRPSAFSPRPGRGSPAAAASHPVVPAPEVGPCRRRPPRSCSCATAAAARRTRHPPAKADPRSTRTSGWASPASCSSFSTRGSTSSRRSRQRPNPTLITPKRKGKWREKAAKKWQGAEAMRCRRYQSVTLLRLAAQTKAELATFVCRAHTVVSDNTYGLRDRRCCIHHASPHLTAGCAGIYMAEPAPA